MKPSEKRLSTVEDKSLIKQFSIIQIDNETYEAPRSGIILVYLLIGILFFVLIIRFWYLQIHRGYEFKRQAEANRWRTEKIYAPRGRIIDRNGRVLADNSPTFALGIIREDCEDIPVSLAQIATWANLPLEDIRKKFLNDSQKFRSSELMPLLSGLDFDMVARIEADIFLWPGLQVFVQTKRDYPLTESFAPILGYLGEVTDQHLLNNPDLQMGDTIGQHGLELMEDKALRGMKGSYAVEVDAHGNTIQKRLCEPPHAGKELQLTLDADLQKFAYDTLGGESGSIVVLKPETGKLLALVSSPSYDNNIFASRASRKNLQSLINDSRSPLLNRTIQSLYPPGSVWKLVMAAMLLEDGVDPNETVHCPGQVTLGKQIFRCWKKTGHGQTNLSRALVDSCDVYFYLMGERKGINRISTFAKACGFGEKTGITLPYERKGLVPTKEWKRARLKRPWVRGDTYNVSIGQGDTLVSPLQMAVFIGSLLNGGKLLKPQLVNDAPVEIRSSLPVKQETLSFIVDAMRKTAEAGTAKVISRKDAVMGGKTGTAQVTKLKMAGERRLRTAELDYFHRDHAWIATWGTKNGETYVVVVMVEHGGGGSSVAGPIARKIYEHLFGPQR